jgi:hypothetical protein
MTRSTHRPLVRGATLLIAAAFGLAGITSCSSDGVDGDTAADTTAAGSDGTIVDVTTAPPETDPPADTATSTLPPEIDLDVRPGVEQLAIVEAEPGTEVTVSIGPLSLGDVVATGTVDELGSLLFRDLVEPAKYFLSTDDGTTADW